ncbi:MAG: PDZ domain-containing protein [Vicinamibacterales bacterium]|nr:PDZ domain-containing protein [Vicinamibacterales bacterium]
MSTNRFTHTSLVLAAVLLAAVVAAVSTLAAQEPQERPRTPRVFTFESRGSQLGVTVSDLEPADLAGAVTGGVRIDEVRPDTAAERAGLQAGDVVVRFDEERVRSTRQFSRLVQETPEGRTVGIDVVRGGQRQSLQVTPEAPRATQAFDGAPGATAFRLEDLAPRLQELEPRLRELEPRLREEMRLLEPRLRERDPEVRQRLDDIERMLRQLLEKNQD